MKRYRHGGEDRIWISDDEIERSADAAWAAAGLAPTVGRPAARIEDLIERHFGAKLDLSAMLDPGVLGETEFFEDGAPIVRISGGLTEAADAEEGSTRGRWRATLAHEAGHVMFHRCLYQGGGSQPSLFIAADGEEPQALYRCSSGAIDVETTRPITDWREVQANKGMAALLMPRGVFRAVAEQEATRLALPQRTLASAPSAVRDLARAVARRMQVSVQAAEIRLETTSYLADAGQRSLF